MYKNKRDAFLEVVCCVDPMYAKSLAVLMVVLSRLAYVFHVLKWITIGVLYFMFLAPSIIDTSLVIGMLPMVGFMMLAGKYFIEIVTTIPRDLDKAALKVQYNRMLKKTKSKKEHSLSEL